MAGSDFLHPGEMSLVTDTANQQALKVITRVKDKLTGRDFIKVRLSLCPLSCGWGEAVPRCPRLTRLTPPPPLCSALCLLQEAPPLDVPMQVSRLIKDATDHENLARHYTGWCAFW